MGIIISPWKFDAGAVGLEAFDHAVLHNAYLGILTGVEMNL
jgi:hypothetical protein